MLEKEKMPVTSIFSFSYIVFYSIVDKFCHLCYLNPFPITPFWDHPKFKEAADDN